VAQLVQFEPHPDYELDIPALTVEAYTKHSDSQTYYRVVDSQNVVVANDVPDLHTARTFAVATRVLAHTGYLADFYVNMLLSRLDISRSGLSDIIDGVANLRGHDEEQAVAAALMASDALGLVNYVDEVSPKTRERIKMIEERDRSRL
jgi:hypothetical protein